MPHYKTKEDEAIEYGKTHGKDFRNFGRPKMEAPKKEKPHMKFPPGFKRNPKDKLAMQVKSAKSKMNV
jgi:hypothetical protein